MVPGMVALAGINSPDCGAAATSIAAGCTVAAACGRDNPAACPAACALELCSELCSCAARANERCRLRRTADAPHKRHDTAAMVRTDERRKKSSETTRRNANVAALSFLVTHGHPPVDESLEGIGSRTFDHRAGRRNSGTTDPALIASPGAVNRGTLWQVWVRERRLPSCAKYFS